MFFAKKQSTGVKNSNNNTSRPCIETLEERQLMSAAPTLWSDDTQGRLFTVNTGTGAVHVVGKMPAVMYDIAFDSHGNLYGVDSASSLWKINTTSAAATRLGAVGATVNSLVFSSNGTLYAAGSALYKLSTANGHGTKIGSSLSGFTSAGDLAFDTTGALYLSTNQNNDLVRVNPSTGSATLVGAIGFSQVYGMAFGPNGVLYGMSNTTDQIFTINRTTGHGTLVSSFANKGVSGVNGSAFAPTATPVVPPVTTTVGTTIYAADSQGNLFTVSTSTGQTHVIAHMSHVMYDIAFSANGYLYGVDTHNEIWYINKTSGALSFVGSLGVNDNVNSLTFGPGGWLYAAGSYLYKINLTNDTFYTEGYLHGYASAGDLAFDKYGRLLMTTTANQLIAVNPANAATTYIGSIGYSQVLGLAESNTGVLYGMSDTTDQIFSIDPITGHASAGVHFTGVYGVYGAAVYPA